MAGFQSPITINQAMQKIHENEYLLPAFQREYEWYPEQIEELFDSLMRDYPISSMLLWRVKDESKTAWKFYRFLEYYRELYHTHNDYFNTSNHKDFDAVLDGQQRLTSLYLALFGNYDIHKNHNKWEDDDRYFKVCDFYFNLTQSEKPKNENVEYEFLWLDRKVTEQKGIYIDKQGQKWFKCKEVYKYETARVRKIAKEFELDENEEERLELFHQKIFDKALINYYLEEEQNPDKAVNIFIRINSGGTSLDYSDILFSIAIANWNKIDARTEINKLVDRINENFSISKDLVLKGFLYLFHNSIKFQINSFDKNFIQDIEEKWETIQNAFIETFRLLRSFGFDAKTLSSNNAILPILYFIYHKDLTHSIVDSVKQKENRHLIKKWLLRATIFKLFGGSGDTVLANTRKAFIKDFKQNDVFFDREVEYFPWQEIEKETKYTHNLDREYLQDNIMPYQKNSSEAFAVLSLLYPNLDYKNNNFHKDHLHPESAYKEYEKIAKKRAEKEQDYKWKDFKYYNSLVNLQMLDANENMAKQGKNLEQWVSENCGDDRKSFLNQHLIPDVDLSLENFDKFAEEREKLLLDRLIEVLNK
ncbi:DUF262 domain-containing protein [Helicobacter winghamensis]|uniref:GmrSD restriction endonucleases N-terminal domain-containing protein n=1 Tax=Helicobacter winghamensis TaxID=157268 RepID=A0A2N3PK75_9HELI|nr:DUF262 domain-containing protein [Helicobacter winghamensis]PKT77575.1 hypothetical protein BCM32_05115 [Helicobacter winghamensis]PKT81814.1 hypothetical protein BCM31_01110 [Helicobacter winghamensis]PKT81992.1 hypothetical protein BCM33_00375 [Helicobacter winghamensis]QOQ98610.1 DUF262 domain-containing protein [Helicobacter winghamensis]